MGSERRCIRHDNRVIGSTKAARTVSLAEKSRDGRTCVSAARATRRSVACCIVETCGRCASSLEGGPTEGAPIKKRIDNWHVKLSVKIALVEKKCLVPT